MCDFPGCTNEATIEIPLARRRTVELCDVHKVEQDFARTHCRVCRLVVQVGGQTVNSHRPYPDPDGFVLCTGTDSCDLLQRFECRGCDRIVKIGDQKTILTNFPYGAPSNLRLCEDCDDHPSKFSCKGCQKILRTNNRNLFGYQPYADGAVNLCTGPGSCDPRVGATCRVCSTPAALNPPVGEGLVDLPGTRRVTRDGATIGWRCQVCSAQPLTGRPAATAFVGAVTGFVRDLFIDCGWAYPAYAERLAWDLASETQFTTENNGQGRTLGRCVTTTSDINPPTHSIQILNYMSPLVFQQTLAHELTHAFTNENGIGNKQRIEGFCNWVSYLFLVHIQNTGNDRRQAEAATRLERMESDPSPTYGQDFREIRNFLANRDRGTVRAWFLAEPDAV